MALTINGIFENGKIILEELHPTNKKVQVKIIFPDLKESTPLNKNEIKFGSLKGKVRVPENFDEEMDELSEYK